MPIIQQHKSHGHTLIRESVLQTELGIVLGIIVAALLAAVIGGTMGKVLALLFMVPLALFFREMSHSLVHMMLQEMKGLGHEDGDDKWRQEEKQWEGDAFSDLKEEDELIEKRRENHEHMYAEVTETEWICICGTHNPLDMNVRIQNCSHCFRCRDFVLQNYGKH